MTRSLNSTWVGLRHSREMENLSRPCQDSSSLNRTSMISLLITSKDTPGLWDSVHSPTSVRKSSSQRRPCLPMTDVLLSTLSSQSNQETTQDLLISRLKDMSLQLRTKQVADHAGLSPPLPILSQEFPYHTDNNISTPSSSLLTVLVTLITTVAVVVSQVMLSSTSSMLEVFNMRMITCMKPEMEHASSDSQRLESSSEVDQST